MRSLHLLGAKDDIMVTSKLNTYGINLPALKLVDNYLLNRKQSAKINFSYSEWLEIVFGIA